MEIISFKEIERNIIKVIVERRWLIIGLYLAAAIASAVISLLMPKIYRGEVVLKLPAKESQSSITVKPKLCKA